MGAGARAGAGGLPDGVVEAVQVQSTNFSKTTLNLKLTDRLVFSSLSLRLQLPSLCIQSLLVPRKRHPVDNTALACVQKRRADLLASAQGRVGWSLCWRRNNQREGTHLGLSVGSTLGADAGLVVSTAGEGTGLWCSGALGEVTPRGGGLGG